MKNLKRIFVAFIAMLTAISCGDPVLPVELQPEMQYGAYARKMSQTGKFDYFAISSSQLDIHVEFYDENNGANIAEYDIDVEYIDITSKGAASIARTDLKTFSSSEFVTNTDGYLSLDITLGFQEALDALGTTASGITGGNTIRYWFTITKTDGSVYDYNNTGPNLMSSNAFGALFRLNVGIVCPSDWTLGTLNASSTDDGTIGANGWDYTPSDVQVELTAVSGKDNQYTMSDVSLGARDMLYLGGPSPSGYRTVGPKFIDNCNVVSMDGAGDFGYGFSIVAGTASVSSDNKTFTYHWVSEYGEGGAATLTYADGSTWPDLYN